jgi:hypothetical protein
VKQGKAKGKKEGRNFALSNGQGMNDDETWKRIWLLAVSVVFWDLVQV